MVWCDGRAVWGRRFVATRPLPLRAGWSSCGPHGTTVADVAAYVDSSVVIAALLGQPEAAIATTWWDEHPRRVSSVLL